MCMLCFTVKERREHQHFALAPLGPVTALCSHQLPPPALRDVLGSFSLFWGHQLWLLGLSTVDDKARGTAEPLEGCHTHVLHNPYTWEAGEVKSLFYGGI